MRFDRLYLVLSCVVFSACSGGDEQTSFPQIPAPTMTPTVAPTMTPSPVHYMGFILTTGAVHPYSNAATPQPLLLGGGLFVMPTLPFAFATLAVSPAPSSSPSVIWSISNGNVSLTPVPDSLAPSAPPGGTSIAGVAFGTATLTATAAPPYAVSVSVPVFYYPSTEIGCDFRAYAGQAFDAGVLGPAADPAHSDMYATGAPSPQDQLDPCNASGFATATGTPVVYHFPYGATLTTNGETASEPVAPGVQRAPLFPYQPATLWRNDFTSIDESALLAKSAPCGNAATCGTLGGTVILFKTKGGRIVKFDIFSPVENVLFGLVEVSTLDAKFPY